MRVSRTGPRRRVKAADGTYGESDYGDLQTIAREDIYEVLVNTKGTKRFVCGGAPCSRAEPPPRTRARNGNTFSR